MDIDVSRFYDDNYEIINGTKIRFFELEGPLSYMLPNRNDDTKKEDNDKSSYLKNKKNYNRQ